eukprot:601705_1
MATKLQQTAQMSIRISNSLCNRIYLVIDGVFLKYPLLGGSLFASFKGLSADIFVQSVLEKKKNSNYQYDMKRTICFGLFGFFYCGMFQYLLYAKLYPFVFRRITIPSVTTQILTGLIQYHLLYLQTDLVLY